MSITSAGSTADGGTAGTGGPVADSLYAVGLAPGPAPGVAFWSRDAVNTTRLYSLLAAHQPVSLIGNPAPGRGVANFIPLDPDLVPTNLISPDGRRVIFKADLLADEVFDVYRVPLYGSQPYVLLHAP